MPPNTFVFQPSISSIQCRISPTSFFSMHSNGISIVETYADQERVDWY